MLLTALRGLADQRQQTIIQLRHVRLQTLRTELGIKSVALNRADVRESFRDVASTSVSSGDRRLHVVLRRWGNR